MSMGLEWYRDVKDLSLPAYIASQVSCATALPLACNKLLVTPSNLVVTAPAQAPINHNHKYLRRTEHAHLLNCPTLAMVEKLDLEQRSLSETKKVRIFNQNPPLPGRPSDPPGREMVYGVPLNGEHTPSQGQPMHDLPALATWGELMTTLIAQTISVYLHTMVVAYIWSNTEDVQADHRDLVRFFPPKRGGGGAYTFFTPINMDLPATLPNLSHFVYQSANGLPRPWHIQPTPMSRGQTWVLNSLGACGWRLSSWSSI